MKNKPTFCCNHFLIRLKHIIILIFCLALSSQNFFPQSLHVNGNVSTDLIPVSNASVTFINEADTSRIYSALTDSMGNYSIDIITSVNGNSRTLPKSFELEQNYPNPFSTETIIPYKLKEPGVVSIKIYNILGQEVKSFKQSSHSTGTYQINWDGKDNLGRRIAPGVYFCQLQSGKEKQIKKMLYQDSVPGSSNVILSGSLIILKEKALLKKEVDYSGKYMVEIKNTANTDPQIIEQEIPNVIVQHDTTLNFFVEKDTINKKLYVYSNSNYLDVINTQTFEVEKQINITLPDSMFCDGIGLSTNRDYFIFSVFVNKVPYHNYIASLNIKNESVENLFTTGLDTVGTPRIGAALKENEPGLFYLYSHLNGLYAIDFLEQRIKETYIDSARFNEERFFFRSKDKKVVGVLTWYNGEPLDYSDFRISSPKDGINKPQIILNENDKDGIFSDDAVFSADNKKLFTTYVLSHGRSREIACYFNYYNLHTGEFYKNPIILPWSLNPYYLEYSPKRKEAYTIGGSNILYIIDTENESLKDSVLLVGKNKGPSRLVLRNDENILFISCFDSNMIYVIDLETKGIMKKISLLYPYYLFIP